MQGQHQSWRLSACQNRFNEHGRVRQLNEQQLRGRTLMIRAAWSRSSRRIVSTRNSRAKNGVVTNCPGGEIQGRLSPPHREQAAGTPLATHKTTLRAGCRALREHPDDRKRAGCHGVDEIHDLLTVSPPHHAGQRGVNNVINAWLGHEGR
jgi:hypothetical protein